MDPVRLRGAADVPRCTDITEGEIHLIVGRRSRFTLPVTWLLECELVNAFELSVFVSRSGGVRISPEQAAAAQEHFRDDLQAAAFLVSAELTSVAWRGQFEELAHHHSARRGYRAYDILHVAAALLLGCDTFWTFDRKAGELARREGLAVN